MNSSVHESRRPIRAKRVIVTDDLVTVYFKDGRGISVPTKWYPRIAHGTPAERAEVEIWDDGVYWPKLNADISYRAMLLGEKSGESAKSFRRWLGYHARGEMEPILTLPLPPALATGSKKTGGAAAAKHAKAAHSRRAG
jgi:hypothetical protein